MNYKFNEYGFFTGVCVSEVPDSTTIPPMEATDDKQPRWNGVGWTLVKNYQDALWFNPSSLKYERSSDPDDVRAAPWVAVVGSKITETFPPSPNHIFNYATKQWEDPRTLQDLKAAQWALIKQARTAAEYAGFTWDGSTFDSDAVSQNRITGAVTLAQLSNTFTIDWTLATNQVRTLNQSEMLQVGAALGVHVQTQFAKGQSLRVQTDAATTQAEVEAIVW